MTFESPGGYWLFAAVGAVVVIAWLVHVKRERDRREAMRDASVRLGMTFAEVDERVAKMFSDFPLFRDHGGSVKNVLRRHSGNREVLVFGHEYTVSSGRHSSTYRHTVVAFRCRAHLPDFRT